MSAFADRVERQIFSPSTPLEIIASCLGFVREQAVKTQEQGLDLTYMLDNRFRRNIERTVGACAHHISLQGPFLTLIDEDDNVSPSPCTSSRRVVVWGKETSFIERQYVSIIMGPKFLIVFFLNIQVTNDIRRMGDEEGEFLMIK